MGPCFRPSLREGGLFAGMCLRSQEQGSVGEATGDGSEILRFVQNDMWVREKGFVGGVGYLKGNCKMEWGRIKWSV